MTIYTHDHHIVPKHVGGTDHPDNIIALTIEQHAQEHLELFCMYGRWQDELAWLGLSGGIGKEDMIRSLISRPRGPMSEEHKRKISKALKGRPLSEEHKQKLRKPKVHPEEHIEYLRSRMKTQEEFSFKGKTHSTSSKEKLSASAKNKKRLTCPHCSKTMDSSNAKKYHFDRCKNK